MDTHQGKKTLSSVPQQAEIIQAFTSLCSGAWRSDENDQNIFTSPNVLNKAPQKEAEKRNQKHNSENNDKYFLLSIPSFSITKHFRKHHDKIDDKKELEEIAISQLSMPFKMMVPLDVVTSGETRALSDLPKCLLKNISRSLLLLIDSRLRSYALLLLRHYYFSGSITGVCPDGDGSAMKDHELPTEFSLLDWKVNVLFMLCHEIRILDAKVNFKVNHSDESEATLYEDDEVINVPLSFSVEMDIQLPVVCSSQTMKVELSSCGSICGSFNKCSNETETHAISFVVDSKNLLKSLISQARNVARQAVRCISAFDINPASPLATNDTTKEVKDDLIRNASEPNVRPILLKHAQQTSKRKKVSFSQTPDLSSENSLPKFSSMESISLSPPSIDSKLKDEDSEFVTIIDSVMELWDLTLSDKAPKRRKIPSPVAASFIQSF